MGSAAADSPGMAEPAYKTSVKSFLSGGFGGMCLVAAGHPLDLIKVRLQTSTLYSGIFDCARKTIAKDGLLGLYRGMSAPLIGVTPIFALVFWGYDLGQRFVVRFRGEPPEAPLTLNQTVIAGGLSAFPATAMMVPAERIKCLLQVEPNLKGPVHAFQHIIKSSGLKGMYIGTAATLLRDVPGSMAYFGAYELVKEVLAREGGGKDLKPLAVLTAGGLAGMANWSVSIPPDVLKSRLQTAPMGTYSGLYDVFRKTVSQDGVSALFRGLGPAMVRAFPANASCFLGVEVSKAALNKIW